MPSKSDKPLGSKKWDSLGFPISKHPNPTYQYPTRTEYDRETGTFVAHPSYGNDRAARDREQNGVAGRDFAYGSSDPRHDNSKNHGPRTNDAAARDREAEGIKGRDFVYGTDSARHWDSKAGKWAVVEG